MSEPVPATHLARAPDVRPSVWQLQPLCLADVATRTWPGHLNLREPPKPKGLPLAWPDKVALVLAVLIAAACVVVWATTFTSVGTVLYHRLNNTLALWTAVAELGITFPVWIALRTVDLFQGGPTRRHEALYARRIEPRFETHVEPRFEMETANRFGD